MIEKKAKRAGFLVVVVVLFFRYLMLVFEVKNLEHVCIVKERDVLSLLSLLSPSCLLTLNLSTWKKQKGGRLPMRKRKTN